MTREEAIKYLTEWKNAIIDRGDTLNSQAVQSLIMAIEALQQEPSEDCVSREWVLGKIRFYAETTTSIEKSNGAKNCAELVELAPSVVPKGSDEE